MSDYYAELATAGGGEKARIDGWRHRLEQWLRFEVVRRGLGITAESSVVDLGCGTGRLFDYLQLNSRGRYLGVDQRADAVACADVQVGEDRARLWTADWRDDAIDDAGPFDFAVAIGTMVDGRERSAPTRRRLLLEELIDRLCTLGERGWALVALDESRLRADPLRRLEPCLKGASAPEVRAVLRRRGVEAVVDERVVADDIVVIHRTGGSVDQIEQRIAGDAAHEAVLSRSEQLEDVDSARRAWFWMISGRIERARRALCEIPDDHRRKALLAQRLSLMAEDRL